MASVTVALKDNDEGEWYSFLLSPEEESRLSQDPSYVSYLLNTVKKKKVTVVTAPPSQTEQVSEVSTAPEVVSLMDQAPDAEDENEGVGQTPDPLDVQAKISEQGLRPVKVLPSESLPMDTLSTDTNQDDSSGDIFEHRFVWNYPAVADLISLVRIRQAKFANPHIKRKTIWREIGKCMFEKGYPVTSEYCERKWRNLRGTYKAIVYKCQKNPNAKKSWEFFHAMNDILKDDPTMNSLTLAGGSSLADPVEPQPTTIRVVSAGGATYHIIEQPQPRPKAVPVRRKKAMLPCRIQGVASLSLPTTVQTQTMTSLPQSVLLNGGPAKVTAPMPVPEQSTVQSHTPSGKRRSNADTEPEWFLAFKRELRESNERNLREIRAMHQENLRVLRERNQVIRGLVLALLTEHKEGEIAQVADALTEEIT